MNRLLLIALGGAGGSVLRYAISLVMARASMGFPYGTLLINVIGSFLLGVVVRATVDASVMRPLLAIGFCGGFTTFSAFSLETVRLLQEGRTTRAAIYVTVSVLASVAATFAGIAAASPRR